MPQRDDIKVMVSKIRQISSFQSMDDLFVPGDWIKKLFYELSHVVLYDTEYLRGVLKMSGLDKKTKSLIKQALAKT